jgi:hypothetical protein
MLTRAVPEIDTVPDTSAVTERPGTTETTCVPRIVETVPTFTVPDTTADTDTPGTTLTTGVPRIV